MGEFLFMRIMIVDDSSFAQQYIKKRIQDKYPGIEFILVSSGEDAYNKFLSYKPNVILTDLLMPGINGQSLIRMIRKIDVNCKIAVISCDIQKIIKHEIEQLNVQCFINKPLDDDNIDKLYNVLEMV